MGYLSLSNFYSQESVQREAVETGKSFDESTEESHKLKGVVEYSVFVLWVF